MDDGKGIKKSLEMFIQPEYLTAIGAHGFKHPITEQEPPVVNRNLCI
jgi:hypothetical protein